MIHTFTRAGLYLALDTGSGAVHVLDEAAYDLLNTVGEQEIANVTLTTDIELLRQKHTRVDFEELFGELCQLHAQGMLYADDSYAEFEGSIEAEPPVKAMCLHIAHDCNLRCRYCFASTGGFGGQRKLMPLETAKQAIDMLVQRSGKRRNLEVDFFGGEPLMNWKVVEQTVEYARSLEQAHNKSFRFTVTTNGILLKDEIIDFINREMNNVVLSIDGRKEVNDAMRPRVDGSGSFDAILPKYQKLVAGRGDKEYYVRGTYTRDNLDFDKDVLALYDAGFDQISVEPVVGPETDDYSIRPQDIPAIEQSYERLMAELVARRKAKKGGFNFFHFMLDLDNGPCAIKRLKGCGSGSEYLAVTPEGDIYPCHQFVGQESFKMGSVETSDALEPTLVETFRKATLFHKPKCQECWAKFFCSGGCNANNNSYAGSIYEPYEMSCELEKIRLECSIAIQALLAE